MDGSDGPGEAARPFFSDLVPGSIKKLRFISEISIGGKSRQWHRDNIPR